MGTHDLFTVDVEYYNFVCGTADAADGTFTIIYDA